MAASNLSATVRLLGGSTSVASSRHHSVVVDRPEKAGGSDLGFLGGELILAGQGGCFLSNLVAAARSRNVALRHVTVQVRGEAAESPARFSKITVSVAIEAVEGTDDTLLDKLISVAERSCIATNTLRTGTQLEVARRDA